MCLVLEVPLQECIMVVPEISDGALFLGRKIIIRRIKAQETFTLWQRIVFYLFFLNLLKSFKKLSGLTECNIDN